MGIGGIGLSHARRPAVVEAQSAADAAMKVFEERACGSRGFLLEVASGFDFAVMSF